ncbi:hypothetical protein BC829DRAFT_440761 [Chytridium lagenaria]|nr:hypothetical protein BC829DRAFT_440761 [Chytridium lagenaria]
MAIIPNLKAKEPPPNAAPPAATALVAAISYITSPLNNIPPPPALIPAALSNSPTQSVLPYISSEDVQPERAAATSWLLWDVVKIVALVHILVFCYWCYAAVKSWRPTRYSEVEGPAQSHELKLPSPSFFSPSQRYPSS